jgi:predicted RNA-binding protein with PUA-like domain
MGNFGGCRRISHRTHHQNHGHVENDESWHPVRNLSTRNTIRSISSLCSSTVTASVVCIGGSVGTLQLLCDLFVSDDVLCPFSAHRVSV